MDKLNTRKVGAKKEELAVSYLEERGLEILERNFRCSQGEIDIIARDKDYLVFVEVKYRSTGKKGSALEAVGYAKQKKICRVFDFYRVKHKLSASTKVRFDVLAVDGENITWLPNAFWYC